MIERLLLVGLNHRLVTFLVLLLVTVLSARGLTELEVDTGLGSLVADYDPDRQAYLRVTEEFGSDNRTLVYVRDSRLWTPERIESLERLQADLQSLDLVERVESILTLRNISGSGDELDTRTLLPAGRRDQSSIDAARDKALRNPLIVGNFVSRDGAVTALMVSIRAADGERDYSRLVNDALDSALDRHRGDFEQVFQIGPSRIDTELENSLFDDLRLLVPISTALLVLTILLFLGSLFAAAVPLLTAALSMVWTFGLMGYVGLPLNILSAMLPSLVLVIGSTEDTHMMATYLQGTSQARGRIRHEATVHMMRRMGVPLVLTVFTTALGFASNLTSGIGLIRDFALASTVAILANGMITLLLVPMVLGTFGPQRGRGAAKDSPQGFTGLLVRLFGFGRRRLSTAILVVTALTCVFFVFQASKLQVTNDPFSYFRSDRALVKDANTLQRDLAGAKVFFLVLESEQERAFLEPGNVARLEAIQGFMRQQGIYDLSVSLADHLALVNREFNGGDDEQHTVPESRERIAQFLLFFHRGDLQGYVSHDYRRANILVRHNVSDSRILNPHIAELEQVAARLAGADMRVYVVGENLMVNAAAENLVQAQAVSLGLLTTVIFLIMSAMFTSLKGGLVALVPSVIPIVLMFGVMGLLGIPLNPGTAMVAVIAIGIAVDGTIHLLSRYNELSRQSTDNEQAVNRTVAEEAVPMVATSLALALGFGVLLASNFTIIAQFGALAAATMLFAVFSNLLITPILMTRIRLVGLYEILAVSVQREALEISPLFRGMTGYQIRKAILISEHQRFEAGDLLLEQGTFGRSLYLVLSGEVEVVRRDEDEARRLAVRGAGEVFGEVGYVREIERTADVRALTTVEALRFDYERMRRDLHHFPRIVAMLNFNISRILGERLAEVMHARVVHVSPPPARAPID